MNPINRSDMAATLFLAALGMILEWLVGLVPLVAPILGICLGFYLGYGLGWVILPRWGQIAVMVCPSGILFLSLERQFRYVQGREVIAGIGTLLCATLLLWGFFRGCKRSEREAGD